ncbi:MAG: regulatory protein RecX [Dehalococcoidia bacterium]|nr:regulatory protein RecX [Dehalococcoidia bacterium]
MDEPPSPVIKSVRSAGRSRMRLIVLDDGREFVFCDEACERAGAREGVAATEELFAALDRWEHRVNAHEAALRLLSHRARSENEMRTRLAMRGIEPEVIEDEVVRLRDAGLLDDDQFARAWVEDRKRFAPRGRRMLRYELLGRGIQPDSVDAVTGDIDDADTALGLARVKARGSIGQADWEAFLAKVGGFLRRRGFDYGVATEAARTVWAELEQERAGVTEAADA